MPLFPFLLAAHVSLAIGLILPALLLPFAFRSSRHGSVHAPVGGPARAPGESSRFVGLLLRLQGTGALVIGAGLAITGLGLLAVLGTRLVEQPWLLVALGLAVIAFVATQFWSSNPAATPGRASNPRAAAARLSPLATYDSTRWAITSVSVSEVNRWPASSSRSFRLR